MSFNTNRNNQSIKTTPLNTGLIISVGSQVGLAIIGIIFVALIVGLAVDELLETEKHPFTIMLFLGSVPFSLIITYWLAKRATKELTTQKPVIHQSLPVEEEDKSE